MVPKKSTMETLPGLVTSKSIMDWVVSGTSWLGVQYCFVFIYNELSFNSVCGIYRDRPFHYKRDAE
jgi:hypothetical protein